MTGVAGVTEETIVSAWYAKVVECGRLARAKADAEIRGRKWPRYDEQGLDALSAAFAEERTLRSLSPLLSSDWEFALHPWDLVRLCREDAVEGFKRELLEAA